jgi:hypothetical protein
MIAIATTIGTQKNVVVKFSLSATIGIRPITTARGIAKIWIVYRVLLILLLEARSF